jgi:hypothetical protein
MIHYYAVGGGLGHLTRGRRVLEALGVEATFITASVYASDPRVTGGLPVVFLPSHLEGDVDAHRQWLRALSPERLIVDTFPGGIQGELCGLDVPMDLVARRLRWAEYRRVVPGPLPRFGTVWQVEDLDYTVEAERRAPVAFTLGERAPHPGPLPAPPPAHPRGEGEMHRQQSPRPAGGGWRCGERARVRGALGLPEVSAIGAEATPYVFWLIVHSGPEDEVRELVAYAEELLRVERSPDRVLVATRCTVDLPPGFETIDAYPVHHLFPSAQKIISAAGFNVMSETEPYHDKHHPIPFPRPFDDQFARAAARKASYGVRRQSPPLSYSHVRAPR